jgi:hypothetical protein
MEIIVNKSCSNCPFYNYDSSVCAVKQLNFINVDTNNNVHPQCPLLTNTITVVLRTKSVNDKPHKLMTCIDSHGFNIIEGDDYVIVREFEENNIVYVELELNSIGIDGCIYEKSFFNNERPI